MSATLRLPGPGGRRCGSCTSTSPTIPTACARWSPTSGTCGLATDDRRPAARPGRRVERHERLVRRARRSEAMTRGRSIFQAMMCGPRKPLPRERGSRVIASPTDRPTDRPAERPSGRAAGELAAVVDEGGDLVPVVAAAGGDAGEHGDELRPERGVLAAGADSSSARTCGRSSRSDSAFSDAVDVPQRGARLAACAARGVPTAVPRAHERDQLVGARWPRGSVKPWRTRRPRMVSTLPAMASGEMAPSRYCASSPGWARKTSRLYVGPLVAATGPSAGRGPRAAAPGSPSTRRPAA